MANERSTVEETPTTSAGAYPWSLPKVIVLTPLKICPIRIPLPAIADSRQRHFPQFLDGIALCVYHGNGNNDNNSLRSDQSPDEDALGLGELGSMERYEQRSDCKFTGSIGEQLQGLRMPYIRECRFNLPHIETFNVTAETRVDGASDQHLTGKPEKLFQGIVRGRSFSTDRSDSQGLIK